VIGPQPGPQAAFLASQADIAILGGAAGGGKSFGLLLEGARHTTNPQFQAVIFRRTLADAKKAGSLFDTSMLVYGRIGAVPRLDNLTWRFPSGATVAIGHLEHETTVLDWQGAQIALIALDELTHFSRAQFFYMLSRNRSTSGVRPYVRATCNPSADSWVAEFIAWWIDQDTGYPIPERSGVIRWFARIADVLQWADSADELREKFPGCEPKSLTFIPAKLSDNAILMKADPGYRANLLALPLVERERLLGGNWKIRPAAGLYFRRGWCQVVDAIPVGTRFARGWDLAATPKTESNDPDWTTGNKMGRVPDGRFIVAHHVRDRIGPGDVERLLLNTASADGKAVEIALPKDPAQAGKSQANHLVKLLAGYTVRVRAISGDKITRFGPFSAQAEAGNVLVLRGPWNEEWFAALEAFPPSESGGHDDDADATAEAFNLLNETQDVPIATPFVTGTPRQIPGQ
jgi:predicted phage terminase large subunit-like protein